MLRMIVSRCGYQHGITRLVIICNTDLSIVQRLNGAYLDTQVIVNTICSFLYCCYRNAYAHTQIFINLKRRGSGKGSMKILPKREHLTWEILVFNFNLILKHSTFFFSFKKCIPCTSQWPMWEIWSHTPNQGIDLDTWNSESETSNDGLVITDICLVSRHTQDSFSKHRYSLMRRPLPSSSLTEYCGVTKSSQVVSPSLSKPKSHRVFILFPSKPKSTFFNKDFSLSLLKHPVSLGTLQV